MLQLSIVEELSINYAMNKLSLKDKNFLYLKCYKLLTFKEISKISSAEVVELPAQRLVALVEGGCRDGRINEECERELCRIAELTKEAQSDTLILGCTHFSHLEGELQKRCKIKTVSPAREGAKALTRMITKSHREGGRIIYI